MVDAVLFSVIKHENMNDICNTIMILYEFNSLYTSIIEWIYVADKNTSTI